jgi:hypothetical protein
MCLPGALAAAWTTAVDGPAGTTAEGAMAECAETVGAGPPENARATSTASRAIAAVIGKTRHLQPTIEIVAPTSDTILGVRSAPALIAGC